MAYNKPAVQVYQELISSGGAANISPDLPACIVGPLKHIVTADLSDPISAANSLASTLSDWVDTEVSLPSPKPGQIASAESISEVILKDALVVSWQEEVTGVTGNSITLSVNSRGTVDKNSIDSPLPFAADRLHIELGDYIGFAPSGSDVDSIGHYTQVLSIDASSGVLLMAPGTIPAGDSEVFIFKKFSQITPAVVDVDVSSDVIINLGPTSGTYPEAGATGLGTDYTFAVDSGITGGTTPLSVYIGYVADRADTINSILEIADTTDLQNQLGDTSKDNPLAFGVSMALANSGGAPIFAIATDPDTGLTEDQAYTKAFELAEGRRLYWMVPLTTSSSVAGILKSHINSMSLPQSGNWRVGLTNFEVPSELYVLGTPNVSDGDDADDVEDGLIQSSVHSASASSVTLLITSGQTVGNVTAGDVVWSEDGIPEDGVYAEAGVVESAEGYMISFKPSPGAPSVSEGDEVAFYVGRTASKRDQADAVVAQCNSLSDKRMLVFPGKADFSGTGITDDRLDGYFLMCAVAGMGSGFPAQTGFTNITIGGVSNLVHGNFYFSEAQLNSMAEAGAFLYVQDAQGTTPYCRHGLTTDVSVLEYREILKVKNWDYLSYYYKDILSPFIGTWNITPDTLQTIRQTITSASETLLGRKLPKVGPPLLSYNIARLQQNANSTDAIDIDIQIAIVSPNNYTNVYLQI